MFIIYLLQFLVHVLCQSDDLVEIYPDYSNHPCNRICDGRKLVCHYDLTLDIFFTMQPDCLGCSRSNQTDCSNPQCIPGDGSRRQILVFNGLLPGPSIMVCQGDIVHARVENLADPETTSIHWHGQHMRHNSWNDGVPMISQCPIIPSTTWRYTFVATEVGTHFYHSHSATQRADGAFGPLIVKEPSIPNESYRYDFDLPEHVISLIDWLCCPSTDNVFRYMRTKVLYTDRVTSILVNGYGPSLINNAPIKTFTVRKGKSYRFRVIHAGNLVCPMEISIDNHNLTVISSDGNYFLPEVVDILTIRNGERYDFILHANQAESTYAIRINGITICNIQSFAMLKYENSNVTTIDFIDAPPRNGLTMNCLNVDESSSCINYNNLSSLQPIEPELKAEPFKYFISFDHYNVVVHRYDGVLAKELLIMPYINQISYNPPTTPLILHHNEDKWCNYEHKYNCNVTGFCSCTHVVPIKENTIVELIFIDEAKLLKLSHPYHLHGYDMRVIGQKKIADVVTRDMIIDLDAKGKLIRNFTNPIVKDTVSVPSGGYTIVRFKADNPGFWNLHCHVDFHSDEGMMMVLAIGPNYPKPPKGFPTCGSYDDYSD